MARQAPTRPSPTPSKVAPTVTPPDAPFIRTFERLIDGQPVLLVDARELHQFLGSKRQFSDWVAYRIESLALKAGQDHYPSDAGITHNLVSNSDAGDVSTFSKKRGKPRSVDLLFTLDTAKSLGMVEQTDRGRQIRSYFLQVERSFHALIEERTKIAHQATVQTLSAQNIALEAKVSAGLLDAERRADAAEHQLAAEAATNTQLTHENAALRQALEAKDQELVTQAQKSYLHLTAALASLRDQHETDLAKLRSDNLISENEVRRRVKSLVAMELDDARKPGLLNAATAALQLRRNSRAVSIRRYYQSLGVAKPVAARLQYSVFALIAGNNVQHLSPLDEDPVTNEPVFAQRDIEEWRDLHGRRIENELGLDLRSPFDNGVGLAPV